MKKDVTSTALIFTDFKAIGNVPRGLYRLRNKPVIEYVLEAVPDEVDELVISVRDERDKEAYTETAEKYIANIHLCAGGLASTLTSYMSYSTSDRYLVLPCDAPLLTQEFTKFLLDTCSRFSAAIIRDANGRPEYFFSGYRKDAFLRASNQAAADNMDEIVKHIRNALYIYTGALRIFDEKMVLLYRVTSGTEARRAERIISSRLKNI
ncbi:MAG: NTP transferase domain-containing protein [Nitrososphaerota archaeon]